MRYVIVGNSAAAIGGVEGIRQYDRSNPILLISDEPYHTYSRPLISYYLADTRDEESMAYRPKDFYARHNVSTLLNTRVSQVNPREKQLILADGETVSYDRLLIATGGKPFVPPIEGADQENIYSFIKLDHAKELKKVAREGQQGIVIGGGLIGLKVAEGLVQRKVAVTVVDLAPQILSSILDKAGAALVQSHLEKQGMAFRLGTTARSIRSQGQKKIVELDSGENLTADFVVIAAGVVPNKDLVQDTEIQVNRGILTDSSLRTSVADVFAAGDVAENYDLLLGQNRVIPILPIAYEQGKIAGANMTGQSVSYPGSFAKNAIGFFGWSLVTAGQVSATGPEYQEFVSQPEENQYLKVVLKEGKLTGFIRINGIDRSGLLTGLMLQQEDVSELVPRMISPDLGLMDFLGPLRESRIKGGVVTWSQ